MGEEISPFGAKIYEEDEAYEEAKRERVVKCTEAEKSAKRK